MPLERLSTSRLRIFLLYTDKQPATYSKLPLIHSPDVYVAVAISFVCGNARPKPRPLYKDSGLGTGLGT